MGLLLAGSTAWAEPAHKPEGSDRYELTARSETFAELFRRALLPGPNGSLITTDSAAPVYEYASLRVSDVDTPFAKDSLDLELSTWGRLWLGEPSSERRLEGDIQSASLRYRQGSAGVRLGRQLLVGGAARYVRFDGIALEVGNGNGLQALAYGGFTVLPRWNEQPRYEHLGAPADTLLREGPATARVDRAKYWLAGARLGWNTPTRSAGLSFHEQRQPGGLARRDLGFDARTPLFAGALLGASALLTAGAWRFADARLWLDATPLRALGLSLEYVHTEPALFLSRQSVLSVFSTASYDEAGGSVSLRPNSAVRFDGSAYADLYPESRVGGRAELELRAYADATRRTFFRIGYTRLQGPKNGYHSVRSGLSRRLSRQLLATLEAYAYFYDQAVSGYRASSVYAGTLSYLPAPSCNLLLGGSLSRSPYASLDAKAELRLAYAFEFAARGGR